MDAKYTQVRHLKTGDHVCLDFGSDGERDDVAAAFVGDGIKRHERVIYITDRTAPAVLLSTLWKHGIDAETRIASGQLLLTRAGEVYFHDGHFDPERILKAFARSIEQSTESYAVVRVTSDVSFVADGVPGCDRFLDFEKDAQSLFTHLPAVGMCQYDRRLFPESVLQRAHDVHSGGAVCPNAIYESGLLSIFPMFSPPGLQVVGEIDISSYGAVVNALQTICESSVGDVHLDFHGVEFIDVGGMRAVVQTAGRLALAERRVIVRGMHAHVRRLVDVAGWSNVAGLEFAS
ncbi:MAG: MEDS domain-containing protein [Vulcanimicrobiaceae bacterium]